MSFSSTGNPVPATPSTQAISAAAMTMLGYSCPMGSTMGSTGSSCRVIRPADRSRQARSIGLRFCQLYRELSLIGIPQFSPLFPRSMNHFLPAQTRHSYGLETSRVASKKLSWDNHLSLRPMYQFASNAFHFDVSVTFLLAEICHCPVVVGGFKGSGDCEDLPASEGAADDPNLTSPSGDQRHVSPRYHSSLRLPSCEGRGIALPGHRLGRTATAPAP